MALKQLIAGMSQSTAGGGGASGNVPSGGLMGEVLTKASNTDGDLLWADMDEEGSAAAAQAFAVQRANHTGTQILSTISDAGTLAALSAAPAGTLTGTTLASNIVTSSLTSVGTITSGTWSGSFGAVSGANLTTLNASNLSSGTVASARLGSTTIGQNLLTATNPSAISFPKVAVDNTVSFRTPAQVLSDIGAQASGSYAASGANADITSASAFTGAIQAPTQINDASGNEVVKFGSTASAVNEITFTNAATGGKPMIAVTGGDSNISLSLLAKGTGIVAFSLDKTSGFNSRSGNTFDLVIGGAVKATIAGNWNMAGAYVMGWCSGGTPDFSAIDSGFSAGGTGQVNLGDGSSGSYAGKLKLTSLLVAGATSGATTLSATDAVSPTITLPSTTGTLATLGANTFTDSQTINRHIIGGGTAPTIANGAGAGTSPGTPTLAGTDIAGQVSIISGTLPSISSVVVTVTFNAAYGSAPYVVIWPANANAATLGFLPYVGSTTTTFTVNTGTLALGASTTYLYNYMVIQ